MTATAEFLFDPDDPTVDQTWTVPGGVTEVQLLVVGGGTWITSSYDAGGSAVPALGWRVTALVTPGQVLTIQLGGASDGGSAGYPDGGEGGGGFSVDGGSRGYGGGGATRVLLDAAEWLVSGGAGGAVENGFGPVLYVARLLGEALPGPGDAPRVPFASPWNPVPDYLVLAGFTPGDAGGEAIGADGLLGGLYGSGGGGGGFGGGGSGGIGLYTYKPPNDDLPGFAVAERGQPGGSLLPGTYVTWDPAGSGDGVYPPTNMGHGYLRIEWAVGAPAPWSVGRKRLT